MRVVRTVFLVVGLLGLATPVYAYTDPGTIGLLGQMGYVVVFALMSALMFLTRPIKKFFSKNKGQGEKK